MSGLLERLLRGPCLLLDGGFGSMLISRGLPAGTPPDRWTLERPEAITQVHRDYVEAGSEAVHANTFGANPLRLARFGLCDRCAEINQQAVGLARAAGARFVLADIGPTGEYLPPVGHGDAAAWGAAYETQARALAGTGIDAFHLETMTDLREALVALEVVRRVAPHIPALASLTFERKRRGFFTVMGDAPVEAFRRLRAAGAAAVGVNCTLTSRDLRDLARAARAEIDAPLIVQPNAGQPVTNATGTRYAQSPEEFASDLAPLAHEGVAAAVGGCCGTDPGFIAALRRRLAEGPANGR